jgi:hypothetical protein
MYLALSKSRIPRFMLLPALSARLSALLTENILFEGVCPNISRPLVGQAAPANPTISLLARKLGHIAKTGAAVVATGNPGCHLQIENGAKAKGEKIQVLHPVSLLAMAYRAE